MTLLIRQKEQDFNFFRPDNTVDSQAPFSYDNSVSLQTDDAGQVGAAVLAHVACDVGLQTNDVRRNWKGLKTHVSWQRYQFQKSWR